MSEFFAAIDVGTSVIKSAVFDKKGRMRSIAHRPCRSLKQKDGKIEHVPSTILQKSLSCLEEAVRLSGIHRKSIASVAVTNQRATIICIDRKGNPLGNAISWQDMRGQDEVKKLKRAMSDSEYYNITGIPNNPVFTLAKVLWVKHRDKSRYEKTEKFVLVHDYIAKELGCGDY
ncbi:MAG: FGGY family carbohydrate kinase, partial [Pseudomonadota bacterium]